MDISRYRKPPFIKKEDVDPAVKFNITGAEEITFSRSGTDPENRVVIDLENEIGDRFKFSLNAINLETIAKFFGDETDQWLGQEIGLKHDPSVKFGDEVRGGIRVIPSSEVPGKPARAPVDRLLRKLDRKPTPTPVSVGIQYDEDGMPIPF